jgi:sugar phosphate isomerase/epimerase
MFLFSSGSLWSYSLERCFAFASQAGFDGMEVVVDQRIETHQADYLLQLIARFNLPVVAIHSPFFAGIPNWQTNRPARIQQSIQLAEAIGAKVVVHHLPMRIGYVHIFAGSRLFPFPTPGFNPEGRYKQWLENEYAQVQAGTDVLLCIENMPAFSRFNRHWQLHHWNTPTQITRFPNLTLDTTHLGTWGQDPNHIFPQLNGQVKHIHLSNYDGREHRRPEQGNLQLDLFLQMLAREKYAGTITLELYQDTLNAGKPDPEIIKTMHQSLAFCKQNYTALGKKGR